MVVIQRLVRAAVGHALGFSTWRSLTREGLSSQEAAELTSDFVSGMAEAPS